MLQTVRERLGRVSERYGGGQPLTGYALSLAAYAAGVAGLTVVAIATGRRPPEGPRTLDVVLVSLATHKLSRILAKESVTSPLRAPLTRFAGPAGGSEVNEEPVGQGSRHAVAELMSCPFCVAIWIATGFCGGLVIAPRITRLAATGLTAVAASDFLQFAYDATKKADPD